MRAGRRHSRRSHDRATAGLGLSRLVDRHAGARRARLVSRRCAGGFPGSLALGIDASDGLVATDGWLETSDTPAIDLAQQFADEPLAAIIYTDIATDGMLGGPELCAMEEMNDAVDCHVIASGGVTTADDVAALADLALAGCIIGRALYEGTLTLGDAAAQAWRIDCLKYDPR